MTVLNDGIEVMHDRLVVEAQDSPVVYKVKPGGTLRFEAGLGDRNLSLVLNHITGQTIWDWPNRQWFVLPEGLVHVELRRPTDDGAPWHILTADYFDIVAGQETVIRVRENDIELVTPEAELSSVLKLHREAFAAIERQYAAGQVTKLELLDAKRSLLEAEYQQAIGAGRPAAAFDARQRIVPLAEEKARIVRLQVEAGAAPTTALTEAKLDVLRAQESVEKMKATLPELSERLEARRSQKASQLDESERIKN